MSQATLIRSIDVLDRCAAPSRGFGLRRDPSSHRYLLSTACLFVAFKFDDGVECRCIPEQGLPFERVEPTGVWRHAAQVFNALPLCQATPARRTTVPELCAYEKHIMKEIRYRLFAPTLWDAVQAALAGRAPFAAALATRIVSLLPPQAAPPRARVGLVLRAVRGAAAPPPTPTPTPTPQQQRAAAAVDRAQGALRALLRAPPTLPGTRTSSLAAWQEHLECAGVHAPLLVSGSSAPEAPG